MGMSKLMLCGRRFSRKAETDSATVQKSQRYKKALLVLAGVFCATSAAAQPMGAYGSVSVPAVHTEPMGAAFAGVNVDRDVSGYAGAMLPLPGNSLGKGWAVRVIADGGSYSYVSNSKVIDGTFGGGEIIGMYQFSGAWGWTNIGVGAGVDHTNLDPSDPGNKRSGTNFTISATTDGALLNGPWRGDWYGRYGFHLEEYQARFSVTYRFDSDRPIRFGPQIDIQGDPTYSKVSYGGFAGWQLTPDFELQLSVGVADQNARGKSAYGTLAFVQVF